MWIVTPPTESPINLTYNESSRLNTQDRVAAGITTTLNSFIHPVYIKSTITLTILSNSSFDGTIITCRSGDLDYAVEHVSINTSGR